MTDLRVHRIVSEPMSVNVYVIVAGREAMVVDSGTGLDAGKVAAEARRLAGDAVFSRIHLTHWHCDHCGGAKGLHDALACPVTMHEEEAHAVEKGDATLTLGTFLGLRQEPCPVQRVREGDRLEVGGVELEVLKVPGHTPASTALYEADGGAIFGGDVAFPAGSFGRVDFPGGDGKALVRSLERLARLDAESLYPGHMPPVEGRARDALAESLENARAMLGADDA